MAKIVFNFQTELENIIKKIESGESVSLDKLAHGAKNINEKVLKLPENERDKYKRLARRKLIGNLLVFELLKLNSPLKKSYINTLYCSNVMIFDTTTNKFQTNYCKNRWCPICNANRTATLINTYAPVLNKFNNPYFVTLTIPNVKEKDLNYAVNNMIKTFSKINNNMRRQGYVIKGIRKLEINYNPGKHYHPHFHIIVDGEYIAELIVYYWLKHYRNAKRIAQDIRPADENSYIELFKYMTKFITKNTMYIQALDTIYRVLRNKKIIQVYGIMNSKEKEIELVNENISEEAINILTKIESHIWTWSGNDWYNGTYLLSGYAPENDTLIKNLNIDLEKKL